jgi:hypothetical protein
MNDLPAIALKEWIPYKLIYPDNQPACEWLYLDEIPFTEPFFNDTIMDCRSRPVNQRKPKVASSLDVLPQWSPAMDHVQPSAFIFHVSRCGSTLLSQFLSLDPSHIVLSEVPFLDELLRMPFDKEHHSPEVVEEWFQWAVPFYGQRRNGKEQHLFIKTDCWHIFFYERLRRLYPDVPFILLYRSPDEVLRSQQQRWGMQAIPGMVQFPIMGLEFEEGHPALCDLSLYFSMVLEKILQAFTEVVQKDKKTMLVNYKQGMVNVVQEMMQFANMPVSDQLLQQMSERSKYHGKYGGQLFTGEPPADESEYLKGCWKWYEELERLRRG